MDGIYEANFLKGICQLDWAGMMLLWRGAFLRVCARKACCVQAAPARYGCCASDMSFTVSWVYSAVQDKVEDNKKKTKENGPVPPDFEARDNCELQHW
jgi:hypothetical protein